MKSIKGTTIGSRRIITFPAMDVSVLGLLVDDQKTTVAVSEIESYLIPENLIEK